ncbi:MAG: hypothetical protein ACRCY4_07890 [Brevinema sp.]
MIRILIGHSISSRGVRGASKKLSTTPKAADVLLTNRWQFTDNLHPIKAKYSLTNDLKLQ